MWARSSSGLKACLISRFWLHFTLPSLPRTNSINGTSTVEVFNNNQGQRLDMQSYTLPAGFASETLTSIVLADNGGDQFQRVFVTGLTVLTPTPGAAAVLGLGGLAALRRRR